jgi:hypothetical protein
LPLKLDVDVRDEQRAHISPSHAHRVRARRLMARVVIHMLALVLQPPPPPL